MAGEVTPHGAALTLMQFIAWAEQKSLRIEGGNAGAPSRQWIISTYAQCLQTAFAPQQHETILNWKIPEK